MPSKEVAKPSLLKSLVPLAKNVQFLWYLGHSFAIIFIVLTTLVSFIKAPSSPTYVKYYSYSLNATIFTYLVVIRETYKAKPISLVLSQYPALLRDDNVQYVALALLLRLNAATPVMGALYPFAIYALYNVLRYTVSNVLPVLPIQPATRQALTLKISHFTTETNERATYIACNAEVLLVTSFFLPVLKMVLLLGIIRSPLSSLQQLVLLAGVIVFLKFRYGQSKYTKTIVDGYDMKINQFLYSPMVPEQARRFYALIKLPFSTKSIKTN